MKVESNREKDAAKRFNDTYTEDGTWLRHSDFFDTPFGNEPGQNPIEPGRYYLIWGHGCNWSHRQVVVLRTLGLDKVIQISDGNISIGRNVISFQCNPGGIDPVLGIHDMSEIYLATDPDYKGRFSIPCVVDLKEHRVAHNTDDMLSIYFETVWSPYHKPDAPILYPEHLRDKINAMNDILYDEVNDGVYKVFMAQTQSAYDKAFDSLFHRLDWLDERLSHQRFLMGDYITDSDIRLYATLIRFDMQYYPLYHANRNYLIQFKNLWPYVRDLYQTAGFHEPSDLEGIRKFSYIMRKKMPGHIDDGRNILPKGPDLSIWEEPHHREYLSHTPDQKFLTKSLLTSGSVILAD